MPSGRKPTGMLSPRQNWRKATSVNDGDASGNPAAPWMNWAVPRIADGTCGFKSAMSRNWTKPRPILAGLDCLPAC